MTDYLFNTNPGVLHLQTQAIIASLILLVLAMGGTYILKKRREFLKNLNRDQRLILRKAFFINIFTSAAVVLFVLFRLGQINYLSMRFLPILTIATMAVVYAFALFKAFQYRDGEESKTVIVDEYAKYLPHKKKK